MNSFLVISLLLLIKISSSTTIIIPNKKAEQSAIINLTTKNNPSIQWKLYSNDSKYNITNVTIPGDVINDLYNARLIENPYNDINFLEDRHVWMGDERNDFRNQLRLSRTKASILEKRNRVWIYEATVHNISQYIRNEESQWMLVLEGIKMGASIYWNGAFITNISNQFRRFMLKIDMNTTTPTNNGVLKIVFDAKVSTDGRFMACSGGWDWAPYTKEGDDRNSRVFTFGIIKPLYLLNVQSVAILHVIPKLYYLGNDDDIMTLHPNADFLINVDVHLYSYMDDNVILAIQAEFLKNEIIYKKRLTFGENVIRLKVVAPKENVKLWWPNGYGSQTLYGLKVQYRDTERGESTSWITKRIGFRTISLVTSSDDEDEGSGTLGMYFKINGAVIYVRGANMIPLDQLEGRIDEKAYGIHVKSVASANMNMLRIWGGGVYYPSIFYDTCDKLGILLYHDLMYVNQDNHYPSKTIDQDIEIRYNIRNLMHHTSIIVWNACNECDVEDGTKHDEIYIDFAMSVVVQEDNTRIVWPGSPSKYGWKSGVFRKNGRPNGDKLEVRKKDENTTLLEIHGPYMHGSSDTFMTVNSHLEHYNYDSKIPIQLSNTSNIGPSYPNTFISEFGISTISSFESMTSTLTNKSTWGLHGGKPSDFCIEYDCYGYNNIMSQRNYPCDNHIIAYFGQLQQFNETGVISFQRQLYQCMISTMLWLKSTIEEFRGGITTTITLNHENYTIINPLGILLWQYNEIWPTGGWGLVEYGSYKDENTVLGGRWKPIMYIMKKSLFCNIFATCGENGLCYIRNDGIDTVKNAIIIVEVWDLSLNKISLLLQKNHITLHGGSDKESNIQWFSIATQPLYQKLNPNNQILTIQILSNHKTKLMDTNVILYNTPQYLTGLYKEAKVQILSIQYTNTKKNCINVHLYSNAMVLFVVLSTKAQGRFSDNAFVMKGDEMKIISFVSLDGDDDVVDIEVLRDTLRVEHLGMHV